jgi:hypothetical protein
MYVLGLDPGQVQDYSALAIVERPADVPPSDTFLAVSYLRRFPLGTSYVTMVQDVVRLTQRPELQHPTLVVDQTGVGKPVVDLFVQANMPARLERMQITAGHQATRGTDGSWHVPKKELVACLQVLLQRGRLKIAKSLPEAELLTQELLHFKVKVTVTGHECYEAWRARDHDDLVLAVALACWQTLRQGWQEPPKTVVPRLTWRERCAPFLGHPGTRLDRKSAGEWR